MPISNAIRDSLKESSWIRRMFEEGIKLKREFGDMNVFDFSLGNPDIEPPPRFHEALENVLSENVKGLHGYMPNAGYLYVRDIISSCVSTMQGCNIPSSHIIMTTGAAGGLNIALKTILNPLDEVIVIAPYFAEYKFYISNHNGIMKVVSSKEDFSLDIPSIKNALTKKTAAIIINSPNNPSGKIYSKNDIDMLSQVLKEHGKKVSRMPVILSDEPYREIVYDGIEVPSVLQAYPETIVTTSYSKSLSLPGERIGYAAISPHCENSEELISGMILSNRILGFVNAPALMQRAIAKVATLTVDFTSYERRRSMLMKVLDDAGIEYSRPEGAFYIFCKTPYSKISSCDDVAFCMHLKKYNILAVPGIGFGCSGYFRLCYAVPDYVITNSSQFFVNAMKDWQ